MARSEPSSVDRSFVGRVTELWDSFTDYLGLGRRRRSEPVVDRDGLQGFLESRASHVAQVSLYGYLRTRTGMRYPELFDDDPFVVSINIAKWQMWLACLSDLAVYTGGLLARHSTASTREVGRLMTEVVDAILTETGKPEDSDDTFLASADAVRARIAGCDWAQVTDGAGPFSESPNALVRWAPVVDEFKRLDGVIVKNSVRFRWQEVRRDLRRDLDPERVLESAADTSHAD